MYSFICIFYILIIVTIRKRHQFLGHTQTGQRHSHTLVKVICLIVSNLIPLLAITTVAGLNIYGISVIPVVSKWMTMVVVALPTLSNPILTALDEKNTISFPFFK